MQFVYACRARWSDARCHFSPHGDLSVSTPRAWAEAWSAWCVAAAAGGSVVVGEMRGLPVPAPRAGAICDTLDAAREAAFARYPDGGSVPELTARGPWWELTWNAGGRSKVSLTPDGDGWALTVSIRETDDGRSVSEQTDGQCQWWIAPATHWRWTALGW